MDFAIVDLETTGILPGLNHRIIEIAVLRLGPDGQVRDRLETLVNPERDLGPTHIHGIMSADVLDAPAFSEIAGDVLAILKDCVFVAHNVGFDARFLRAEMARCGVQLPAFPTLCTMALAHQAWPNIKQRSLGALCQALDIPYSEHHRAMSDVRAAAEVFEKVRIQQPSLVLGAAHGFGKERWPVVPVSGRRRTRGQAPPPASSFIARLVGKLPAPGTYSAAMDAYLCLLDQALLDRVITTEEAEGLLALACDLGLDQDLVMNAHRRYVRDLVWYAQEDEVITDREDHDLRLVCQLLGVSEAQLQGMITSVKAGNVSAGLMVQECDLVGKSVCFTGALSCQYEGKRMTRSKAHRMVEDAGMVIAERVTQELDYLVVADPNTQSGKARKARSYGTAIVAEVPFWLKLGVEVQ